MTEIRSCVYIRVYNSFLTSLNSYAQHFETFLQYFKMRFSIVVIEEQLRDNS